MKKTGILTLYYNNMNYGGLLQAFALPFVIQKHIGIPAEQIRYSQQNTDTDLCTSKSKKSLSIYQLGINIFSVLTSNKRSIRKESFLEFLNDIPHRIYIHMKLFNNVILIMKYLFAGRSDLEWRNARRASGCLYIAICESRSKKNIIFPKCCHITYE